MFMRFLMHLRVERPLAAKMLPVEVARWKCIVDVDSLVKRNALCGSSIIIVCVMSQPAHISVAVHFIAESVTGSSSTTSPRDVTVVAALGATARVLPRVRVRGGGGGGGGGTGAPPTTAPTAYFDGAREGDVLTISAGVFGAGEFLNHQSTLILLSIFPF